jgi:hypothetical protein
MRHGMAARKLLSLIDIYYSAAARGHANSLAQADDYAASAYAEARQAAHWWALYRGEHAQ